MKFVRLVIALHASHRYGGIPSSNLSAKVPAPTPGDEFALPDGGVLLANICSGAEEGRQSPATFYPYTDGSFKDGRGSWAFVVVRRGRIVAERSGKAKNTTSNRMEFQAALEALARASGEREGYAT